MKKLITLIVALTVCFAIHAQNAGKHAKPNGARQEFSPELYKKKLNEFVTREAQLTEAEAAKFFPLLSEMQDKQYKLMKQQRELMVKGKKGAALSEAEYAGIIETVTNTDVEIKKIEQTYYKKFHTVLSWKKVYAVRQALNRFQMEALRQFHPGKGNQQRNDHKEHTPKAGDNKR